MKILNYLDSNKIQKKKILKLEEGEEVEEIEMDIEEEGEEEDTKTEDREEEEMEKGDLITTSHHSQLCE